VNDRFPEMAGPFHCFISDTQMLKPLPHPSPTGHHGATIRHSFCRCPCFSRGIAPTTRSSGERQHLRSAQTPCSGVSSTPDSLDRRVTGCQAEINMSPPCFLMPEASQWWYWRGPPITSVVRLAAGMSSRSLMSPRLPAPYSPCSCAVVGPGAWVIGGQSEKQCHQARCNIFCGSVPCSKG
jgi:hypothetical protein